RQSRLLRLQSTIVANQLRVGASGGSSTAPNQRPLKSVLPQPQPAAALLDRPRPDQSPLGLNNRGGVAASQHNALLGDPPLNQMHRSRNPIAVRPLRTTCRKTT